MPTIKVINYKEKNDQWFAGQELSSYLVSTNGCDPTRGDIYRFAKMGNQLGILTTEYGGQYATNENDDQKEFGFWPANEVEFTSDDKDDETDFLILLDNALLSGESWRVWGKVKV